MRMHTGSVGAVEEVSGGVRAASEPSEEAMRGQVQPPANGDGQKARTAGSRTATGELKDLLHHSTHYLAGLIGSLGLGFVSFPIYTRVFSVADYGMIDLAQKVLLLLTAGSKMGLQNAALRFYDGRAFVTDSRAADRYYSTMFFGMALSASAATAIFLAAVRPATGWLIDAPLAALLSLAAVMVFLRPMQSMLWSFLRIEQRTKAYSATTVSIKAATILAVCLLLHWTGRRAQTYFIGAIIVEAAAVALLSLLLFRRGVLRPSTFDPALFRAGIVFGLPLIVYEIAAIVLDSGDRVLVRNYLGANALGYYSVAYGLSQYVNELLITPLNLALLPIYMRLWTTEGREKTIGFLSVGLDLFLMAAAGVFAVAAVTAHDALFFLASVKYRGADGLIPIIVAGLLIYTTHVFLSAGLLIHKNTLTMAKLLLWSALLNIALNCLLLPRIGLQGAAIATLLSYVFCILLLGRASFRLLPLTLNLPALGRYLLASAVTCGAVYRVQLGPHFVNLVGKAALALAVYGGVLYLLDGRFRQGAAYVLRGGWRSRDLDSIEG